VLVGVRAKSRRGLILKRRVGAEGAVNTCGLKIRVKTRITHKRSHRSYGNRRRQRSWPSSKAAAEIATERFKQVIRDDWSGKIWVSYSESPIGKIERCLAMIFIGARLGKNLDAPETHTVVFRGEGVLVYADFPNRLVGRHPPAAEAIDIDLTAIWARRRSSQYLQFIRQVVGIVGERIEVAPAQHDLTGI
jgi:hypothetical protein